MKTKWLKVLWPFGAIISLIPLWSQGDLAKKHNRPGVVYWHGDIARRRIALTFDDGPNEPYTSQILKILKEQNVRATFFMVGKNVEAFPEAAKAVAEAGHVIGNHSYDHPNMILRTDPAVRKEILSAERTIWKVTGQKPRLFRPPFGGDDPLTFWQTERLGYLVIKWSLSAKDWERPGVMEIRQNVLRHIHNGAIILMHDGDKLRRGGDRSQTVKVLPDLISELRRRGYEFVTVPQLLDLPL